MMTAKDKNKAYELIENALEKRKELLENKDDSIRNYFKSEAPPVLWFGDLNAEKPKVVVISANPNNPHEEGRIIPEGSSWDEKNPKIENLIDAYNNYFKNNPKTTWFGKEYKKTNKEQGRIEDFLNGLDASFYDKTNKEEYTYQAIHIDILPFATTESFSLIADELMTIDELPEFINNHIRTLIEIIKPTLIIINGKTNFNYFNLCVNLGNAPYKVLKYSVERKSDIFISKNNNIIATSVNLGNNTYNYKDIKFVAEKLRDELKF